MILNKIGYDEFAGTPQAWSLKEFSLDKVNLLVGKNATGKTRTIHIISCLANMLSGVQPQLLTSGDYKVAFADATETYLYFLQVEHQQVINEQLLINGEVKLERNADGVGRIFANKLGAMIEFQLPDNQLVVLSRRDAIQHPYLEKLYRWANGVRLYEFGKELGKNSGYAIDDINKLRVNPRDTNTVAAQLTHGVQKFGETFQQSIREAMAEIGYQIKTVGVAPNPNMVMTNGVPLQMIYIIEQGRNAEIFQSDMSQGMFRALSLLIQITYNVREKISTTVLIDDIGEGLDFDRSSSIVKLLPNVAKENDIQFIMSTNDRFIMNGVPLKHWQFIQRDGHICTVHNYVNSKGLFEEFEYTGLSNFDFLRTDFIHQDSGNE